MSIHSEAATPTNYQRRIGERFPVRVNVAWNPVRPGHFRPTRHQARRPLAGMTLDMSLSGIGFEAGSDTAVERGQPIMIKIGDAECVAAVRAIRPGTSPGRDFFGIEFSDPHMIATVQRLINAYCDRTGVGRDRLHPPEPQAPDTHYFDRLI